MTREYIVKSPAQHLVKPRIRPNVSGKAIRQVDFERLLRYTRTHKRLDLEALLMFLGDTGCRAGELCSLSVDNINFEKCEALVCGKTGERIVDFAKETGTILKNAICYSANKSGPVFINSKGQRMTVNQLYSRLKRLSEKIDGIVRFNPQSIRHRIGQAWIDKGANLELVRQ